MPKLAHHTNHHQIFCSRRELLQSDKCSSCCPNHFHPVISDTRQTSVPTPTVLVPANTSMPSRMHSHWSQSLLVPAPSYLVTPHGTV